jgi:hypothetical protein
LPPMPPALRAAAARSESAVPILENTLSLLH